MRVREVEKSPRYSFYSFLFFVHFGLYNYKYTYVYVERPSGRKSPRDPFYFYLLFMHSDCYSYRYRLRVPEARSRLAIPSTSSSSSSSSASASASSTHRSQIALDPSPSSTVSPFRSFSNLALRRFYSQSSRRLRPHTQTHTFDRHSPLVFLLLLPPLAPSIRDRVFFRSPHSYDCNDDDDDATRVRRWLSR